MDDITKLIHDLKQQIAQDYAELNVSVQRRIDTMSYILRFLKGTYGFYI